MQNAALGTGPRHHQTQRPELFDVNGGAPCSVARLGHEPRGSMRGREMYV